MTTHWASQGRCPPLLYWLLTEHPKGDASHCYALGFTDYLLSTPRAVPPIAMPMALLTTYWAPQGLCLPLLYPWLYWLLTEHPKGDTSHCYTHGFTDYLLSTPRAMPPIAMPMALLTTYWAPQGRCLSLLCPWLYWLLITEHPKGDACHCYAHGFTDYLLSTPRAMPPIAMPMALLLSPSSGYVLASKLIPVEESQ